MQFFPFGVSHLDFIRMRESIELPNLCDKNRISAMLSDVLAANDRKKNFFPGENAI